jgi:Tfp pilus assembly protein PilO
MRLNFTKESLLKNKILLMGIALALIALWYGYHNIYKNMKASFNQLKLDLSNEGISADIAKNLAALQGTLGHYEGRFVKETDMLWVVDRVSRAANESGLKVTTLNSSPLIDLNTFLYSSANISVVGTFHQLGDFISRIEGSREFMRIERLSFKKEKEYLKADAVVSTYFWK